jgi:hypothetical protein
VAALPGVSLASAALELGQGRGEVGRGRGGCGRGGCGSGGRREPPDAWRRAVTATPPIATAAPGLSLPVLQLPGLSWLLLLAVARGLLRNAGESLSSSSAAAVALPLQGDAKSRSPWPDREAALLPQGMPEPFSHELASAHGEPNGAPSPAARGVARGVARGGL